jgi:phage/plasmid-associated DNA primase
VLHVILVGQFGQTYFFVVCAGEPKDMILKVLPYNKEMATTDKADIIREIDAFIMPIALDPDTAKFLVNSRYYVLSGVRSKHKFLMIVGYGGNGKGLFDFLIYSPLSSYLQRLAI